MVDEEEDELEDEEGITMRASAGRKDANALMASAVRDLL